MWAQAEDSVEVRDESLSSDKAPNGEIGYAALVFKNGYGDSI